MKDDIKEVHIKSYDEWLKYYENATKEQVIEDLTQDVKYFADAVKDIKYLQEENEYNNFCNEKLREKITNLEYKITTYENHKSRNEKAIEYMNNYIEVEDAPINERIKTEFKEVIRLLTGGDE